MTMIDSLRLLTGKVDSIAIMVKFGFDLCYRDSNGDCKCYAATTKVLSNQYEYWYSL